MAKVTTIEFLIKKGIITPDQINRAKEEVEKTGLPIEKALEKLGFVSEIDITKAVADSIGIPFIDLTDYLVDYDVINLVPEDLAKKFKVLPLFRIGNSLTVAMSDPQDIEALDQISIKTGIGTIEPALSTPEMLQKAIDQYYGTLGNAKDLVKGLNEEKIGAKAQEFGVISDVIDEGPLIKLVNLIILGAVKDKASDIHIEPAEDKLLVRYRVDGILQESQVLPKHTQNAVISRIKVMSKMDIAETRLPQDGRIEIKMEGRALDLRVSSFPTIHGENVVMRILDKSAVLLGLAELGFSGQDLKDFDKAIRTPNGIILVTGPTGSGKTTTLYAALQAINSIEKNIITVEDPVEYQIPLIRQTQINTKIGLTFANGLRSILRQDPDIVMVGEIRDKETAEIAIQASLTGHLVLSTLHTNNAAGTLIRLLDMGIESFLISSSIIGILAQRLVRLLCPKCKEKYTPSDEVLKDLNLSEKVEFYRGKGCMKCKNAGFSGRIGIYELLLINQEIKDMVLAKASADEIEKKARSKGMRSLYDDGLEKVKRGLTSIEEVLRVTEEF
ncbi:MAG: type II secretion system ATPase GspE [Candidatus Omnitrophota bacterium]